MTSTAYANSMCWTGCFSEEHLTPTSPRKSQAKSEVVFPKTGKISIFEDYVGGRRNNPPPKPAMVPGADCVEAKLPNEILPSCRLCAWHMLYCHYLAGLFFEKNMKSTCIILRMVYIKYWNRFLLHSFLFHALLNVNTDLRIWNCRRFAHKSTNTKQRPHYVYAQKNVALFSVCAEKV